MIIDVQPMVICFSWEKHNPVAPKDVYRPSIFFFRHPYRVALAVNKSLVVFTFYCARSTDLEVKIEGLWTGYFALVLSVVCMIKTAPGSTFSSLMWCIKSTKGWFTHTQICWQDLSKLVERKKFGLILLPDLISRPNLLWSRAIMALKCDRRWLLLLGCTYKAINSMKDFF